jgi:hypothetical protein
LGGTSETPSGTQYFILPEGPELATPVTMTQEICIQLLLKDMILLVDI